MNAFQTCVALKDSLTQASLFNDQETTVSIQGDAKKCEALVMIPVEGKLRLVRIKAEDLGIQEGLKIQE